MTVRTGAQRNTAASRRRWLLVWVVLIVYGLFLLPRATPGPVYGGGVNPTPNPTEQARDAARVPVLPSGFVGARITNSANQESGPVVRFDTVRWESGGWFDPAVPTRLTFPVSGICEVTAQATILGTAYYGAPANSIALLVRRDGDPSAFVAGSRLSDERPEPAIILDATTTDWFEAGEYLEMFVEPAGLLVESNWPGRANLSPVLTVVC